MKSIYNKTSNTLTFDQIREVLKTIPAAPMFSDLNFVENSFLPENTVIVSRNIMKILKTAFDVKVKIYPKQGTSDEDQYNQRS